jgi:hypothetical protein
MLKVREPFGGPEWNTGKKMRSSWAHYWFV